MEAANTDRILIPFDPLEEHHGVSQPNATMSFGTFFFISLLGTRLHTYVRAKPVQTRNILPSGWLRSFKECL